jgi:hypothetical protein
MNSLPQPQPKITLSVDVAEASAIVSALGLLARSRLGTESEGCERLLNYVWAQSFHDLGKGRAA